MIKANNSPVASITTPLRRGALAGAALLGLCASSGALAQVQRSFINLGFEQPNLTTAGCRVYINSTQVPGWQTTHPNHATENSGGCVVAGGLGVSPGPIVELWRTPRNNSSGGAVNAPQGVQIAELNAAAASRIYQNVCLINGERVNWRFSHRGRGSSSVRDVAEMKVGASATVVRVGTTNNGSFDAPIVSQGTANAPVNVPGNTSWVRYSGSFNHAGATGVTNIGFEAISAQGGATNGNLLDDIQIELAPLVEFTQASSSTPESASSNLPTLRVNGTVLTPFTVTVNIVGGTASRPADYTTPGNSSVLTINVPAGNYDGTSATGSLFTLPVTVVNDLIPEPNETIRFEIAPASGTSPAYQLRSSATCGGAAQTTWEYTLIDDDGALLISKNASAPVPVGGSLTQYDITYTIAVSNPSGSSVQYATLADTPAFDPDVTISGLTSLTRATTPNAGGGTSGGTLTATPLNTGGPWNLITNTRTLGGGRTDTYTLVVRFNINPGDTGLDDCSGSGRGLYNAATATRVAAGNPAYTDSACQATPTPVWVTLRKQLQGRAAATDQFQVRLFSGGIPSASATTSGSAMPSTASTGQQILAAGTTLHFEEALKANGTGADEAPTNYTTLLTCTNANGGSPTVLPGGSGSVQGNRQLWPEFTPTAGDVIDCTITNSPAGADLSVTKTNNATSLVSGMNTTYTITVTNNGPGSVTGAVLQDTPNMGLSCPASSIVTCTGSGCPATPSPITMGDVTSGLALGTLAGSGAGNTVTLTMTCTVQ